ncbi:ROK family protein [Nonomuraea sp. NPDC000554]|uniref:ROK family protein n=1 Tax=Nonomuraea sp. NPDC000554 TaxID=3154259 RepID=UPI003324AEC8
MVTRLGIDVGGTTVKWVLLEDQKVVGSGTVPTPSGPEAVVALVAELLPAGVESIGIGLPGHVDRASGVALFVPNPPGDWDGFPIGPALSARTGLPVAVINDARAFALAELRMGAAKGLSDVLFAVLGTGVGGAVALGGEVLPGPRDNLGEVGHITVDSYGPECCCGNRGCVEAFAAGPGIVRTYRGDDVLGGVTPAQVAEAARRGERAGTEALSRAGWALGVGLGDAVALLGVRTVVVGGGVAGALDLMRPAMRDVFERRRPLIGDVAVLPAVLGPLAGAIGAALYGGKS